MLGAGRSSEVERSLMVRWVVGSILHGVDPLSYFSFQPVLHDWCNKGHGMCYPYNLLIIFVLFQYGVAHGMPVEIFSPPVPWTTPQKSGISTGKRTRVTGEKSIT